MPSIDFESNATKARERLRKQKYTRTVRIFAMTETKTSVVIFMKIYDPLKGHLCEKPDLVQAKLIF